MTYDLRPWPSRSTKGSSIYISIRNPVTLSPIFQEIWFFSSDFLSSRDFWSSDRQKAKHMSPPCMSIGGLKKVTGRRTFFDSQGVNNGHFLSIFSFSGKTFRVEIKTVNNLISFWMSPDFSSTGGSEKTKIQNHHFINVIMVFFLFWSWPIVYYRWKSVQRDQLSVASGINRRKVNLY